MSEPCLLVVYLAKKQINYSETWLPSNVNVITPTNKKQFEWGMSWRWLSSYSSIEEREKRRRRSDLIGRRRRRRHVVSSAFPSPAKASIFAKYPRSKYESLGEDVHRIFPGQGRHVSMWTRILSFSLSLSFFSPVLFPSHPAPSFGRALMSFKLSRSPMADRIIIVIIDTAK